MMLKNNEIIENKYKIISQVGRGGMAVIYHATDIDDGKDVAIKVLLEGQASDEKNSVSKRFEREFTSCSKLNHRNIVKLYHMGTLTNGQRYYAMEYLPTQDLDSIIIKHAPLNQKQTYFLIQQIVSAFACFHKEGIVHRDLKPGNIMVCEDGRAVIVDFGLAKDFDKTALTATNCLIGTPLYMAPEVIKGETAQATADIFALGVIAYEMLTGENPFKSRSLPELATKLASYNPPSVKSYVPELAGEWDVFIGRCLIKNPADRYSSGEQMLSMMKKLASVISGKRTSSYPDGVPLDQVLDLKKRNGASSKQPEGQSSREDSETNLAGEQTGAGAKKVASLTSRKKKRRSKAMNKADSSGTNKAAQSGISSPITNSSLIKSPSQRPMLLKIAPLVVIIVIVLGSYIASLRPSGTINALRLKSTPIPGGATITWESSLPYISKIQVTKPSQLLFEGASDTPSTTHIVHLTGIGSGKTVEYVVVYPNNEHSLPNSLKTGELYLPEFSAVLEGNGFSIQWKNPVDVTETAIEVIEANPATFGKYRNATKAVQVSSPSPGISAATIPAPVEQIADVIVKLKSPDTGTLSIPLSKTLIKELKDILKTFSPVDFEELVVSARNGADKDMPDAVKKELKGKSAISLSTRRYEVLRAEIRTKHLSMITQEKGLPQALERTAKISTAAFAFTSIPREMKDELYAKIMSYLEVIKFSGIEGQKNKIPIPTIPYLSHYLCSASAKGNGTRTIPVFTSTDPKGTALGTPHVSLTYKPVQKLSFDVVLDDKSIHDLNWAQLAVQLTPFNRFTVHITVNNNTELVFYDRPFFSSTRGRVIVNYQRIPPSFLKKGTNSIVFTVKQLFGDVYEKRTFIQSVKLILNNN